MSVVYIHIPVGGSGSNLRMNKEVYVGKRGMQQQQKNVVGGKSSTGEDFHQRQWGSQHKERCPVVHTAAPRICLDAHLLHWEHIRLSDSLLLLPPPPPEKLYGNHFRMECTMTTLSKK